MSPMTGFLDGFMHANNNQKAPQGRFC